MKLSPSETLVLKILTAANGRAVGTGALVKSYYRGDRRLPEHARIVMAKIVRVLERKTRNGPVRVYRSKRAGPHEIEAWVRLHTND